jgi:hypothetical protein
MLARVAIPGDALPDQAVTRVSRVTALGVPMAAVRVFAPERTLFEVCDRCGAVGMLRVVFGSGLDLMFCWHHATRYRLALEELEVVLEESPPAGARV